VSAEAVAYSALSGDAPLIAVVGTKIYPDVVPAERPLPAIAVFRLESRPLNTIHGGAPLGADVPVEIWCMAETRLQANEIAALCLDPLTAALFTIIGQRSDMVPVPEGEEANGILASVVTAEYFET